MVLSSQAFEPGNFDLEHHWWDMIVKVQGFPLISFGYVRMPSMNILVKNVEIVFERKKKKFDRRGAYITSTHCMYE